MRYTRNLLFSCTLLALLALTLTPQGVRAQEDDVTPSVEEDLGAFQEAGRTDDQVVEREAEAIKLDGLSVAEMKQLRDSAEKKVFAAEVNRSVLPFRSCLAYIKKPCLLLRYE